MSASGDKKHPASPRKLKKAREEGNVAQSATLTASFATLTMSVGLGWSLSSFARDFLLRSRGYLDAGMHSPPLSTAVDRAGQFACDTALRLAPLLAIAAAVAVLVAFLQVGPVVATKALAPKLDRLNPVTGLKERIFSMKAVVDLLRNLLTIVLLGAVLGAILNDERPALERLPFLPIAEASAEIARVAVRLLRWGGIIFVAVGVADFAWQRFRHLQDQRMTDQELKEERRDDSGDPEVVRARKQRHKEIVREGSLAQAKRASFVARNPTHIACAVLYDPESHPAPMVIAKGAELMALRMVDIARENGVEMVEDIPLARALYRVPVGKPVPAEMLAAVQAVLEQIQERMLRRGECPPWLRAVLTSEELDRLERTLATVRENPAALAGPPAEDEPGLPDGDRGEVSRFPQPASPAADH